MELWPGGIEYEGGAAFPVTTDSVLLADFARVKAGERVFEPCCGAGLISLLMAQRAPSIRVCALEIDPGAALSARRNFAANGVEAEVVCGDLRDATLLPEANSCGLCVCNPPYFAAGRGSASPESRRAAARSEGECTFADVARAAARSLRQGGRFASVHRRERLAEPFGEVRAARLEPKRLRFIQHSAEKAPELFLCEAVRLAAPGLAVAPPLVLFGPDGRESLEARRIYHMEG